MAIDRDFLKRLAELTDGDEWAKADLLVEKFPPDEFGDHGEPSSNTGLHAVLEAYETEMATEYGIELKTSTMRRYRATSLAWPRGVRTSRASFDAHQSLRGPEREEQMRRYLGMQHQPLSGRHVRRYRAEDAPKKAGVPWEAQVARAVTSLAKRLLLGNVKTDRDDWWNAKAATKARRNTVVAVLRSVAASIDGADE